MFSYGGCVLFGCFCCVAHLPTHIAFAVQKNVAKGRLATFRYGFDFV